jgi:protocatechuate 3,4-dioxygenase, alpha subunit
MSKPRGITPAQTVGPFFHFGLVPAERDYAFATTLDRTVAPAGTRGQAIVLTGRVLDGDGAPVPDAMIELWQADADGVYASAADGRARASNSFRGFGRSGTDKDGVYRFETIKPGAVPAPGGGLQAPHVGLVVFTRGLLVHLFTRAYFADEAATATDPILAHVPADRRDTLIARPDSPGVYRHDIRLQGEGETVFFAV